MKRLTIAFAGCAVAAAAACQSDNRTVDTRVPTSGSAGSTTGRRPGAAPPELGPLVTSAVPPPPLSGGTLTVLADGVTAVAADPDRDRLYVVDLATERLVADVALAKGEEPGRVVEGANGRVHIALRRGASIATLDGSNGWTLARHPVCAAPRGMAFDRDGGALHVACAEGAIVKLDEASGTELGRTALERDVRDVVLQGDRIYVSRFRTAEVLVLDRGGRLMDRMRPPAEKILAAAPPADTGPGSGASSAGGLVDATPSVGWRLFSMGGDHVALVHQAGTTGVVATTEGGYGGLQGCNGAVESALWQVGSAGRTTFSGGPLPIDGAVSRDGKTYAVVFAGNAHNPGAPRLAAGPLDSLTFGCTHPITRLPSTTDDRPDAAAAASAADAGAPDDGDDAHGSGVARDAGAAPETIDVEGVPPGLEPVAVAFDGRNRLVVQSREPAQLYLPQANRRILLSNESRADTGHAIFHSNSGVGLACASCHPEGGEDARVWSFDKIGARRTQALRGRVTDTAPFHWDGDLDDLGTLMTEVFSKRMSGPALVTGQLDALGAWMDTIPLLPRAQPADEASMAASARGKALFESPALGCVTCHAGAKLTNNATVDVGTKGKFQVPTLRGVGWRAPFMHDGCAATLLDRFGGCGGGDHHGVTSTLSEAQKRDLTQYLDTL